MSTIIPGHAGTPVIGDDCYLAEGAIITDDTTIGSQCSVWHNAVLRGDDGAIKVGDRTNVQDNATLHSGKGHVCTVGSDVTIGHNAIVHGCTVGDRVLVGMGAIIMNGAVIGDDCIIGAGALVTERTEIPAGHLALGSPARVIRPLKHEEIAGILENATKYLALAQR
jgi:carbonic anhydrase/acetyltransferase-like protein (isoleucine patch superfamily)